ncbi:MAG: redoxin family protein [Chitinophagaceae bacterium]
MKKIVLLVLSLALLCPAFAQKKTSSSYKTKKNVAAKKKATPVVQSLSIGSEIPNQDIMLQSALGHGTNLQQARKEQGLLVVFVCNSCPCVRKALPLLHQAMSVTNEMQVGMVLINSNAAQRDAEESPEAMRQYASQNQLLMPYLIDEGNQMVNAFGATHTPEMFLFNSEGKLVYKGALEDSPLQPEKSERKYVIEALKAMQQGKSISPDETKSIGCSIRKLM